MEKRQISTTRKTKETDIQKITIFNQEEPV